MQSRGSILVVDDDPVHLRIYGWIMNAAGFRAVTAQVLSNEVCCPRGITLMLWCWIIALPAR